MFNSNTLEHLVIGRGKPLPFTMQHALDLELFQHHCHKLFQIDITVPGGDGFTEPPSVKDKWSSDMGSLIDCIQCIHQNKVNMLGQLAKYHHQVLYTICTNNDI